MDLTRRNFLVYGLLLAVWALVVGWQAEEHARVREAAKTTLSNRSKDIANTVSACLRGMRFRRTILQERLQPVLNEIVNGGTNELVKSSELMAIVLLNAAGEPVASAGQHVDLEQKDILQKGERWGVRTVVFINPVDLGASLGSEGETNPTVVLPPMQGSPRRESRAEGPPPGPPPDDGDRPAKRGRQGARAPADR